MYNNMIFDGSMIFDIFSVWMRVKIYYFIADVHSSLNKSSKQYLYVNFNWFLNTVLLIKFTFEFCLQETVPDKVHEVYIIKPDAFWEKRRSGTGLKKEQSSVVFEVQPWL